MSEEQHLSILVEAAPVAIVVADHSGRIALINAQVERLFGYDRAELLGQPVEKLIPQRFTAVHPALRQGYAVTPSARPMGAGRDLFALRKDGSEVPVEIGLSPIKTPQGDFVLATVIDISERKHAEEMRLAAARDERRRIDAEADRDRALDASQLKSQFVATMSHELRTPLNAIIGMAELLGRAELRYPERGFVEKIIDSAEGLLGLINGILEFSKIEAGKLELEIQDFEFEAVVARCAEVLFQQARQKGLTLHVYVDPMIPQVVQGDPDRLSQILLNLVGNAIKFTERGRIVLRALPAETMRSRTTIRFEVEDTGIGIPGDVLPKLFEPFVQGDSSASRRFGGTGLGLSISKRLVELMRGEIGVSSEVGVGSLFWFTSHFLVPRRIARSHRMSGVGVLIAVDDEELARILERYLAAWEMQSQWVRGPQDLSTMLGTEGLDAAADWVAIVDADSDRHLELTALLRDRAGIDPTRIVRIGTQEAVGKPVRQSTLFDGIVAVMNAGQALKPEVDTGVQYVNAQNTHAVDRGPVLVAEDNLNMHEVLVLQFEELGRPVKVVVDGAQAVAAIQRDEFSLVFMDCQMPNVDGFEATRMIRDVERRTGKRVPIVAMTANAFKEDREACLAAGMDDYLSKPVRLNDLRAMLDRWAPSRAVAGDRPDSR